MKCGKTNASMKANDNPLTITLDNAIELIKNRKAKFEPKVLGIDSETKKEILIKTGRFGPYVTDGNKNVSLKGYKIDFVSELMGTFFKISNPKTKSSCGCGISFSI